MSFLRERMQVSPETGAPDPDLDVSDASGEVTSLRRAIKQIKDARWNIEKALDDVPDEERKAAYRAIVDELDKLHGSLAPTYDALRQSGATPRVRGQNVAEAERIARRRGAAAKREHSGTGQDVAAAIGKPLLAPLPDDPDGITYARSESRTRGGRLLREAHGTLDAVMQASWYPGVSTWSPPVEFAAQGDYGLGDPSRGVVRAVAADARGLVHPNAVAEMIAQAVVALYAEGRDMEYPWHGHTTGMPDELGEGMIVTQEEVYWAIRRISGDNAATPEYLDEVYKELNNLGLRVATKRPSTLERIRYTP